MSINKVSTSINKVNMSINKANTSINKANMSINKVNTSINKASMSINKVNMNINKVNMSINKANISINKVNMSINKTHMSIQNVPLSLLLIKTPSSMTNVEQAKMQRNGGLNQFLADNTSAYAADNAFINSKNKYVTDYATLLAYASQTGQDNTGFNREKLNAKTAAGQSAASCCARAQVMFR